MSRKLAPGDVVDGFELTARLGSGGFGDVWRALDVHGTTVALKVLRATDQDSRARFARESKVLMRIEHPNVVRVVRAGEFGDAMYLATEFVAGATLDQWLSSSRPSLEQILDVAHQIAAGLAAAHKRGIVHRDLKPPNIIIETRQQTNAVRVIDFGLAKIVGRQGSDVTKTGLIMGTPGYMSPEQLNGSADIGPATDQYCLGVILFEMLERRPPFTGTTPLEISVAHLTDAVPQIGADFPNAVSVLVARLLAKEPSKRFPSMRAARGALEKALMSSAELRHRPTPRVTKKRSPKWPIAVAAAFGVVLVLATILTMLDESELPPMPMQAKEPPAVIVESAPPSPQPRQDAALVDDECEPSPKRGLMTVRRPRRVGHQDVWTYVPESIAPGTAAPTILLLRTGGNSMTSDGFIHYTEMIEYADRTGSLLIAPNDKTSESALKINSSAWDDYSIQQAWFDAVYVREEFCLQDAPIALLGEGKGGHAVDLMICQHSEEISAAAVSGNRYHKSHRDPDRNQGRGIRPCKPDNPVPYLYIAHTKDDNGPWKGGAPCGHQRHIAWSFAEQDSLRRQMHSCTAKSKVRRYEDGDCQDWGCAVPYTSCKVRGGRDWGPGHTREEEDHECGGPLSKFPHRDVVVEFFDRHVVTSIEDETPDSAE